MARRLGERKALIVRRDMKIAAVVHLDEDDLDLSRKPTSMATLKRWWRSASIRQRVAFYKWCESDLLRTAEEERRPLERAVAGPASTPDACYRPVGSGGCLPRR